MREKANINGEKLNSVVVAAMFYFVCQVLVRGMGFLTTPIFTRLLTKQEYGQVSNFFAWEAILYPLITLNIGASIGRSKYDFPEENDSFLLSIVTTGSLFTFVAYLIVELNRSFFVKLFEMDVKYIRYLFIYILFLIAFNFQQSQHNVYHKYKLHTFYSALIAICNVVMSVLFVTVMKDRVGGRLLGYTIPMVFLGLIIQISIWMKGRKIKLSFSQYALKMTVPLLPSAVSSTILSSSDRIIITKYWKESQTALYSVAYSVSSIASIVWGSLNRAWAPWLRDNLDKENIGEIRRFAKVFSLLYLGLMIGLMLIAPELVLFFGGRDYMETVWAMPPVILAMVFQFFYAFYFELEYFYGETYMISLGTLISAVLNIVLNFLLVPQYGYIAASYTTMIGYLFMLVYHYCIVKFRMKKEGVFDNKFLWLVILLLCGAQLVISFLYSVNGIRYIVLVSYIMIFCVVVFIKRKQIIRLLRKG